MLIEKINLRNFVLLTYKKLNALFFIRSGCQSITISAGYLNNNNKKKYRRPFCT